MTNKSLYNILTQVVEHKNISDVTYPIVADPTVQFSHWFTSSSGWIKRNGVRSLSLVPTTALRVSCAWNVLTGNTAECKASWTATRNKYSKSGYWYNESTLWQQ